MSPIEAVVVEVIKVGKYERHGAGGGCVDECTQVLLTSSLGPRCRLEKCPMHNVILYEEHYLFTHLVITLIAVKGRKLASTFKAHWTEHSAWRRDFSFLLRLFSQWLKDNALLDATAQDQIKRLDLRVRAEKLTVAFVAEFSRGKSELINAIFFAEFGRRIMPTSAGRTTMCPTEIAYEADTAPSLRLLPIHTRLQSDALTAWREVPEAWTHVELDVRDPDQLVRAMQRLTETMDVTPQEAQALGLWHPQTRQAQWSIDASGLVQVPKWRHALVNIEHPLLKQGLVILDTPGLNALGAEPELTMGLLDQAQAHVFLLSADTGVSKSDLAMWQEHMAPHLRESAPSLVVLNKIDTLWDELSSSDHIARQIETQKIRTAKVLGIDESRILAVSAQKGLVAKISKNPELLEKSGLLKFEDALAHRMLAQRQHAVRESLKTGISELQACVDSVLLARSRDLREQCMELESLRGKSRHVLMEMRLRITHEQHQFEQASTKMSAVQLVYRKLFHSMLDQVRHQDLAEEMQMLADALGRPGLKWDVKRLYGETFDRLQERARSLQNISNDLHSLQLSVFSQLNAEYGFMLHPLAPPSFSDYAMDLELAKRSHLAYVGLRHAVRLQRPEFVKQVVRALFHKLQTLQAQVRTDAQRWRQSVVAQIESQTAQRRTHFLSRLESVEKVERAADGFDQRLSHITNLERATQILRQKLAEQACHLSAANDDALLQMPSLIAQA